MEDILCEAREFCAWKLAHGVKPSSMSTRFGQLKRCIRLLHGAGRPWRADAVREEDVYWLKDHLEVKESTARYYVNALAQLIRWKAGRDLVGGMAIMWNRPQFRRCYITSEQMHAMLQETDPTTGLFIILGSHMGLRMSEILGLRLSDIHGWTMTVRGKGHGVQGKVREQPMGPTARAAVSRYIAEFRGEAGDDRLLVFRYRGRELSRSGDRRRIGARIRNLGRRMGFEVTTHSFRRLYAMTLYYQVGADIKIVQTLMGHADAGTTMAYYVAADPDKVAEAVGKLDEALT